MYGNIQAAVTAMLDVVHPGDDWQAKYDWYFDLVKEGSDLFDAARSVLDNVENTNEEGRRWALQVFDYTLAGIDPDTAEDNRSWFARQRDSFRTLFDKKTK